MDSRIFSIIYVTLFLVLSLALYVVIIPSKNEYNDYKKSRRILGFGMFLVASAGIIRLLCFPPTKGISYIGHFAMTGLSLIFTSLNFISFLYMIETSRLKRKVLKKISIACTLIVAAIGSLGLIFPETQFYMKLMMSSIYVFACIVLFTGSIREYDKFILQMDNFYDDELNIKWIPGMLWATFCLALIMTGSFYHKPVSVITGIGSLLVYTTVCMKLLSFIPDNIHVVRRNIKENKIIAQDHGEHLHIFPLDGPAEPVAKAENTIIADKDAKRNEKIASLMEKWVNMEGYIKPDINIKDVASEMGTNGSGAKVCVSINK